MIGPLGIAFDNSISAGSLATVSADTFAAHFWHARKASPRIAEMTSPFDWDRDESGTTFRLSLDGRSGYAVRPDGEFVYLFSLERGRGNRLVSMAVYDGARHLDCFDGYLVGLYGRYGFTVTRRERNWTPGEPDVVYMAQLELCDETIFRDGLPTSCRRALPCDRAHAV